MKILQITYSLASGGAERFVVDMCNELVKNEENEVYLLVIRDLNIPKNSHYLPELSKDVKCLNIGATKGLCWKSVTGVYKIINEIKPNIVHAHCDLTLLYLPSLFYRKTIYIHTLHTLAEKNIVHEKLKSFQRFLYRKYVQGITISELCQKSFVDFYNLNNSVCIHNGRTEMIKSKEFQKVEKEIEKYKKAKELPVFIHVGRFSPEKNQKRLFEAFLRLKEDDKRFLLIVIGAGFEESEFYELNKLDEFKILGKKNNVADYLACADYFALSSNWEGLPLAMIEAMSMGCIPISTPAGGVVDVIKDGINGLLCPTFDTDDYHRTIEKVFKKDFFINKDVVINDYKKNYTMEVCANKYFNVYKLLCKTDN